MDAIGSSLLLDQTAPHGRDPVAGPIREEFEAASLDLSMLLCSVMATSSWPLPRRHDSEAPIPGACWEVVDK